MQLRLKATRARDDILDLVLRPASAETNSFNSEPSCSAAGWTWSTDTLVSECDLSLIIVIA
jgi:hypothetical protein